jgi:hypothetical protein
VVVVVMVGVGIVVGGAIALLASRWPVIAAPRVAPETVATGVHEHASLWRHLRRHYDPKSETGVALIAASAAVVGGAGAGGGRVWKVRG